MSLFKEREIDSYWHHVLSQWSPSDGTVTTNYN